MTSVTNAWVFPVPVKSPYRIVAFTLFRKPLRAGSRKALNLHEGK